MLTGYHPIDNKSINEYRIKILSNQFMKINQRELWEVSLNCKSAMIKMMDYNLDKRYTINEILNTNWFENIIHSHKNCNIEPLSINKTINLWHSIGSMTQLEKCIQRAVCKSIEVTNIDYINKLFFKFDSKNMG